MGEEMVRVRVKGVGMASEDSQPVVILEETAGSGTLAVSVGAFEAGAILMELEGLSTPRPLTHDLLAQLFVEQRLKLDRVELYGLYGPDEDGFLARIYYGRRFRLRARDVRPSDALALAVAMRAPVYVHPSLLGDARSAGATASAVDPTDGYWFLEHAGQ